MNAISRRTLLKSTPVGFGMLAAGGLLAEQAMVESKSPTAVKKPHFEPRAKRVIFMCMRGAPAQTDTFDYKPRNRKVISTDASPKSKGKYAGKGPAGSVLPFRQHGESGLWIADSMPNLAKHADDLCLINSMYTDLPNHPQSYLMMHTGDFRFARPSVGAWVLYGLGAETQDLPGFISINAETRVGGAQNYGSAFLPAVYQGTPIGYVGADISKAGIKNVTGGPLTGEDQLKQLELIQKMNQQLLDESKVDTQLEGAIQSLELGRRMQHSVSNVLNVSRESPETLERYNVGKTKAKGRCRNDDFGRQCLWARRLAEAGVRYIEVCHSNWDQHGNHAAEIEANGNAIDKPIAALLQDLKDRDMLKDTLVVWGGEFGRTPLSNPKGGSGHNNKGFTYFMAGGGVKGGMNYGKTNETGAVAVENKVHTHDLHATMLHLLGLDHEKLTYRYAGRDFRLTDVYGNVIHDIIS